YYWNGYCQFCKTLEGVNLPLSEEVAKNYYDEDCDGFALDVDGDGQPWPEDCHDGDKTVYRGAKEIIGNHVDEDCDGMAIDWDGDGEYNPAHIVVAEELGLDPEKFTDCDDYDREVKKGNPVSKEIGSFSRY